MDCGGYVYFFQLAIEMMNLARRMPYAPISRSNMRTFAASKINLFV